MQALTRFPVLFEDARFIIVDKPAGVLSHPNPGRDGKLGRCAFLGDYDHDKRLFSGPAGQVWLVHRLDQDTSGVLLGTKDAASWSLARRIFKEGLARKTYELLVSALPKPTRGVWKDRLEVQRNGRYVRSLVHDGRPNALLRYRLIRNYPLIGLAHLEAELVSGKTHQIRVQAAAHGHPLAGDGVYGDFKLNRQLRKELRFDRLFLHARSLEFRATGCSVKAESKLPGELKVFLEKLY